jgi:hypothetical protein
MSKLGNHWAELCINYYNMSTGNLRVQNTFPKMVGYNCIYDKEIGIVSTQPISHTNCIQISCQVNDFPACYAAKKPFR